jgi:hypothetical protein
LLRPFALRGFQLIRLFAASFFKNCGFALRASGFLRSPSPLGKIRHFFQKAFRCHPGYN